MGGRVRPESGSCGRVGGVHEPDPSRSTRSKGPPRRSMDTARLAGRAYIGEPLPSMPKPHRDGPDTLVVVSYYDGRPADDLIRLLDEIGHIPAGRPFALRVVVNRTQDRPL